MKKRSAGACASSTSIKACRRKRDLPNSPLDERELPNTRLDRQDVRYHQDSLPPWSV
jgi:hypothetical protein